MASQGDIAIVGMACLFPGAADLAAFARNLRAGVDAIGEVPPGRWDPVFYDPRAGAAADRFYGRRGGFVDALARFDALGHGIMPVAAATAEPDQLLTLDVAARALADAGLDRPDFDRKRAGVIIGRGNYAGAGRTRLEQHVRGAEQLVRALRQLVPDVTEAQLAAVKQSYQRQVGAAGPDGAIGLVPNLTASRIAHRLDLGGPAYTVDAACASALLAVDQAVTSLRARRLDTVIAGGVHFCQDEAFWSVFCQLGALSRRGQIRPFDRAADGMLIGEGAGLVVLRRREDAEKDGDRIYALIRGTGVASDGRGASLMSPAVEGQVLALERAWQDAGCDPASVGFVEAHGTATPAGDAVELESLRRVFGAADGLPAGAPRAALGSVKSMIGHAMPAAGAAGLIKAALSLHERTIFPSLHCEEPSELVARTRFRVPGATEPWELAPSADGAPAGPRRAAVNAFGFGGIDAHVVLEEHGTGAAASGRVSVAMPAGEASPTALLVAAADPEVLLGLLAAPPDARVARVGAGPCRLAVLHPTTERLVRARAIVEKGRAWRGRDGIWFVPRGLATDGGKVAFLYPGVDAQLRPRLADVARHFDWSLPAEIQGGTLSIEHQGVALVESGRLLTHALAELGVRPAAAFGHSVGEWSALIASGAWPREHVAGFIDDARTGTLEVPGVAFAAAGCGVDKAAAALAGLPRIAVSHDNCPHQVILCGIDASIDEALVRLKAAGVLAQKLPFRSGFHSPLFADFLDVHRKNFAAIAVRAPAFPLWSATLAAPYPSEPDAVRALCERHLVEPVRFRELVRRLHAEGVRVFVQVGPGSALNFVEDTLRGESYAAVPTNVADRSGLEQLWRAALALFAEGLEPALDRLAPTDSQPTPVAPTTPKPGPILLALGVPLVEFTEPLDLPAAAGAAAAAAPAFPGVLGVELAGLFDDVQRASAELAALALAPRAARAPAPAPAERRVTRRLSVETHPWLLDHTFFRQPPGWSVVADRHPVVPMTTTIQFMMNEAAALVPGMVAVGVENLHAFRWLAVPRPVDVSFDLHFDGVDRVAVVVDGFAQADVLLAPDYPAPPPPPPAPTELHPSRVDAHGLYAERWMFHGPQFHGVKKLGPVHDAGILGEIETGAAPGALLDNAGQLLGFWVMQAVEHDRFAMPIGVERLRFHGPHPAPGTRVLCDVRITTFDAQRVVADLVLSVAGRVWCTINAWEDRRFATDERLWNALLWPESHMLSERSTGGVLVYRDIYRAATTREQLMRRYLGEAERSEYEAQPPRGQRSHLAGRIAAKDAVRDLYWKLGHGALYPVEVSIVAEPSGRPQVVGPGDHDVRVSIAHKGELAVALAAQGRDVGVDLEVIEHRPAAFAEVAFTPAEQTLIGPDENRDEWLTRLWTAKEAVGKLLGTGLGGNPRRFEVTDRTGERLLCRGHWVDTRREGDYVIGWTVDT